MPSSAKTYIDQFKASYVMRITGIGVGLAKMVMNTRDLDQYKASVVLETVVASIIQSDRSKG